MITQDITSRLVCVQGETTLETAYSNQDKSQPIEAGRCLYLARFELAPEGHPELTEDLFNFQVRTIWDGLSSSGTRHGGRAKQLLTSYEDLIREPEMPSIRAEKHPSFPAMISESSLDFMKDLLADVIDNETVNGNARIYSEFSGYWQAYRAHFDEAETFLPVIEQACRDLSEHLRQSS